MTLSERQTSIVRVLLMLEPSHVHAEICSGTKNPEMCNCYIWHNARMRADALADAGLLCSLDEVKT